MHLARQRLRRFFGRDADGFAAAHIHESRRHLSPVAKLQRALAQAATSDHRDGVSSTPVNLNEGDESLAILAVRIVDAEFLQAEHREPHAKNLPGTEVSVGLFGVVDVFVEGFHKFSYQLSAVSSQLTPLRSFPVPAHAVFCDLYYDVSVGELRADCVGGFEVTGTTGSFHLGNLFFDVRVGKFSRLDSLSQFITDIFLSPLSQRPIEDLLQLGAIIIVQHRKYLVKFGERVQQRRNIILPDLTSVKGSVGE